MINQLTLYIVYASILFNYILTNMVLVPRYNLKGKQVEILHGPAAVRWRFFKQNHWSFPGRVGESVNPSQKTCHIVHHYSTVDGGCWSRSHAFFCFFPLTSRDIDWGVIFCRYSRSCRSSTLFKNIVAEVNATKQKGRKLYDN
jgi:hypothetical protein